MVKNVRILNIHRGEGDIEVKIFNGEDDISVDGDAVDDYIYTDDNIFNLQAKIYRASGIYPPHAYIWFNMESVSEENILKTLLNFYYSTINTRNVIG